MNIKRLIAIALVLILAISLLTACGGDSGGDDTTPTTLPASAETPEATRAPETTPSPTESPEETPEETPAPIALMNDAAVIFEKMEAILVPMYEYYEEHDLCFFSDGEAVHLAVPGPIDFSVNEGLIALQRNYDWSLGELYIRHNNEEKVRIVTVSMDDDDRYGGMENVYLMAQAVYASCVEGMTPELGKKIADALHMGDSGFTMPEGKYDRVLIYEGYTYYSYKGPSSGPYTRIWVFPASDSDWRDTTEVVFFDIDGNMIEKP